jgi:PAS domain S-box-containing protein
MGILEERESSTDQSSESAKNSGRIIIVDDNVSLCKTLKMILGKEGYNVTVAYSGQEAIDQARLIPFDLALLDVRLPDIDGTDLISELLSINPLTDFVIITGYASVETAVKAIERQASALLTKPLDLEKTLRTIADILDRQTLVREKVRAEEALRISEEKYRTLVENTSLGIEIITGDPMRVAFANSAIEDILGYTPEEVVSFEPGFLVELAHLEDRERVQKHYQARMSGKDAPSHYEIRAYHKSGEMRWLSISASRIEYDENPASLVTIEDITVQRKAEQAVRESEEWFRTIFKDSPIAINVFDANGDILAANDACLEFAGVSSLEELAGLNVFNDPNFPEHLIETVKSGESVIFSTDFSFDAVNESNHYRTTKKGVAHIVSGVTPLRLGSEGEIQGYIVQIVDETAKVNAEKELLSSEVLFRGIFEQSPIAIELFDIDGNLVNANQAALDLFGLPTKNAFIGFNLYDDPNTPVWIKDNLKQGKSARYEYDFSFEETRKANLYPTKRDGRISLDVLHTPLDLDGDGVLDGVLSQIRDITAKKEAEESLMKHAHDLSKRIKEMTCISETSKLIASVPTLDTLFQTLADQVQKAMQYPASACVRVTHKDMHFQTSNFQATEWSLSENISVGGKVEGIIEVYYLRDVPFLREEHELLESLTEMISSFIERKRAESALLESEERHRTLVQSMSDLILVFDEENRYTQFYGSHSTPLFVPSDQLIGKRISEVLPPQVASSFEKLVSEVRTTRESQTLDYPLKIDNRDYWFSANMSLHENKHSVVVVVRDISDARAAKQALQEEKERAERFLNIAGAAIVVLDSKGNVQLINRKGCEILECSIDDIIGRNWFESFIPPKNRAEIRTIFERLLSGENGDLESNENPILTTTGEERIITWRNKVIRDEHGTALGTISSGVDVTDRKKAEDDHRAAAETATLYLDIMGHDIRNNLQAIVMATDILSNQERNEESQAVFDMIVESVRNAQGLINQVQMTRELLLAEFEEVNLCDIFTKSVELNALLYNGVQFEIDCEIDQAMVEVNEYVRVLFDNLIDNAVRHNPHDTKQVWVTLRESGDGYEVEVSDNGKGIDDARKESLFNPERRFGGVGVHQSKSIVEKYGGSLSIRDRVEGHHDHGASFVVWLPRSKNGGAKEGSL